MAALPLVKYSCGCVGLAPGPNGDILMVMDDMSGSEGYGLYPSALSHADKSFEPLATEAAERITMDLNRLIQDGYRLQQARAALGIGRSFS